MGFTLVIGNKNYSSWSLRPWLAMRQAGIEFTEIRIPLYTDQTRERIAEHSPTGKVPVLHHDVLTIWDSLAICEYVAELFPDRQLWPSSSAARAIARSVSAEMHAGFSLLRQHMPMDCRNRYPDRGRYPGVDADIQRVVALWQACREQFGRGGDFLFGDFCIADAMYAPVVTRFVTYGVELGAIAQAYVESILALPTMQEWITAAEQEEDVIQL
jgi:glutathione S-transferase